MCRKCGEPDKRSGAPARRRRRAALLAGQGHSHGGNGTITVCVWCDSLLGENEGYLEVTDEHGRRRRLRVHRLEQDRISRGGPYLLWNLAPSCGPCNRARTYDEVAVPDGCTYGPVA